MRIRTKSRQATTPLPADVPSAPSYPARFMAQLLMARIAMLFRR